MLSPGRFFAISEIKLAFAQLILKYDFKIESKDGRIGPPPNKQIFTANFADPDVEVLFKKRG
jgi:hypothetical protein